MNKISAELVKYSFKGTLGHAFYYPKSVTEQRIIELELIGSQSLNETIIRFENDKVYESFISGLKEGSTDIDGVNAKTNKYEKLRSTTSVIKPKFQSKYANPLNVAVDYSQSNLDLSPDSMIPEHSGYKSPHFDDSVEVSKVDFNDDQGSSADSQLS